LKIKGDTYIEISVASANISDSFVIPANKSGSAFGEARLYVSSQKDKNFGSFFTFNPTTDINEYADAKGRCFFY